jgi:hypothetical protein
VIPIASKLKLIHTFRCYRQRLPLGFLCLFIFSFSFSCRFQSHTMLRTKSYYHLFSTTLLSGLIEGYISFNSTDNIWIDLRLSLILSQTRSPQNLAHRKIFFDLSSFNYLRRTLLLYRGFFHLLQLSKVYSIQNI